MTRTIRRAASALALIALTVMGGCASGGEGGGEPVLVEVQNDLVPPSALTIYLLPEVGARRLLGNVSPSETATLQFSESTVGQVRLVARTTAGTEIVSNPVTFGSASTLEWDLSSNILTVRQGGG
jgi:hypothetical protein